VLATTGSGDSPLAEECGSFARKGKEATLAWGWDGTGVQSAVSFMNTVGEERKTDRYRLGFDYYAIGLLSVVNKQMYRCRIPLVM
jgi:hypothetical protein